MANKKYILSPDGVTEVIYINMNVHATGGKKEAGVFYEGWNRTHLKNYRQQKKKRMETVKELILNNFAPYQSSMVTLTFAPTKASEPGTRVEIHAEQLPEDDMSDSPDDMESRPLSALGRELTEEEIKRLIFAEDEPEAEIDFRNTNVKAEDIFMDSDEEWPYDCDMSPLDSKPAQGDLFCNIKICNKEFKKFIQRMNYKYDNFRYVAVMARQDNRRWHYHMFCNLPFIDYNNLQKIWRNGGVFISKIDRDNFEAKWKYALKNIADDKSSDLEGENGYLASRGLKRNIVYRSWKMEEADQCANVERYLKERSKPGLGCWTTLDPAYEPPKGTSYTVALQPHHD